LPASPPITGWCSSSRGTNGPRAITWNPICASGTVTSRRLRANCCPHPPLCRASPPPTLRSRRTRRAPKSRAPTDTMNRLPRAPRTPRTACAGVSLVACLFTLALLAGCGAKESHEKIFEDVTASSGLGTHTGVTHGAYWGDYDGDGLPDVYVTNHLD